MASRTGLLLRRWAGCPGTRLMHCLARREQQASLPSCWVCPGLLVGSHCRVAGRSRKNTQGEKPTVPGAAAGVEGTAPSGGCRQRGLAWAHRERPATGVQRQSASMGVRASLQLRSEGQPGVGVRKSRRKQTVRIHMQQEGNRRRAPKSGREAASAPVKAPMASCCAAFRADDKRGLP